MALQTINPTTNEVIANYEEMSSTEVSEIIDDCHEAYELWREQSLESRIELLKNLSDQLEKHKEKLAMLMATEMGKPITAARAEVDKCKSLCAYYAENIAEGLKPKEVKTEMAKSYVAYKPMGVIFAIMPWNYPVWQVLRFAVPNITAGNVGILKHAPICTGTSLEIENLFIDAGYPKNVFRSLVIDTPEAANVIANQKVKGVTLTGSERAGSAVGEAAGKSIKKVVLELGGSDPYIILDDADLELAAEVCVASRMANTGQVCISAKRLIVLDSVQKEFKELVLEKLKKYKMTDPLSKDCNFGPMAREDLRAEVHRQVQDCVSKGCSLLLGGELPEGEGNFYPPTVLDNVTKGTPAYDEEIFGPVIAFISAKDESEAIKIANQTKYGLGAGVFTQDLERGEKIASEKLHAGTCCVNTQVKSDPRLPFGGIKNSGYGRELAFEGLHEFLNIKTVSVK